MLNSLKMGFLFLYLMLALLPEDYNVRHMISSLSAIVGKEFAYKMVWNDEFDGKEGSAPDSAKWMYERVGVSSTGWGGGSLNAYTDNRENSYIDGEGHLVIRALQENYRGAPYTSARLGTKGKGDWKHGILEVRAKLPDGGKGIWPAIWLMPTDDTYGEWPKSGEIDLMEMIGTDSEKVVGTLHFADFAADTRLKINSEYRLADTGFHTYTLMWNENQMDWLVDGVQFQSTKKKEWNGAGGNAPFDQRFYLIMNIAVGGTWPGNPDDSVKFPQDMIVDYVRVYQNDQ